MNMTIVPETLAMSSKEIAVLTGKRHDHILRDIRSMLSQVYDLEDNPTLGNNEIAGVSVFHDQQTKRVSEISLDKEHTLTLLTGYDAKARLAVIRRWQELETATAVPVLPDFSDPVAAARAWADATEQRMIAESRSRALLQQIETDKPYTELARAVTGNSTMTRRDWCALMKTDHDVHVGERAMTPWLIEQGYLYRDQLTNEVRAYAQFSHLFKLEPHMLNGFPRNLLMVTGQGVFELTNKVLAAFAASDKPHEALPC